MFEVVYTSVMATGADVRVVADIVRRARSNNRINGISGILVFDGQRFCQLIEGDNEKVLALMRKIATDPRHQQFTPLHQGFAAPRRRFGDWSLAYALDDGGVVTESLAARRGSQAADFLVQAVGRLEMQPD